MKKFIQILALVTAIAFGYGLGQQGGLLFATTYSRSGAGGGGGTHPVDLSSDVTDTLPHGETSNDAANVHGLGASINVVGNLDASGEFFQRAVEGTIGVSGSASAVYAGNRAVTFGTAFSNRPFVAVGSSTDSLINVYGTSAITTTGFTYQALSTTLSGNITAPGWIALGD